MTGAEGGDEVASFYWTPTGKQLPPQLSRSLRYIEEVIDDGFVSDHAKTVFSISHAADAVQGLKNMKKGDKYIRGKWLELEAWMEAVARKGQADEFVHLRYISYEDVRSFYVTMTRVLYEIQVYGSYFKDIDEGGGQGLYLEYGEYNWQFLLQPGAFIPVVGANGSGKSNFLTGVATELAGLGYVVITNIAIRNPKKYRTLFVCEKFSDVIRRIGEFIDKMPRVALIFDEFEGVMNAWKQGSRKVGELFEFLNQMRKFRSTMIVLIKNEADLNRRHRDGEDTGGAVPIRIYKGAYGFDEYKNEAVYYREPYSRKKTALLCVEAGTTFRERVIEYIPNYEKVFFTGKPSAMKMDLDVEVMFEDLQSIKTPKDPKKDIEYYQDLAKVIKSNLKDWMKGRSRRTFTEEMFIFLKNGIARKKGEGVQYFWEGLTSEFNTHFGMNFKIGTLKDHYYKSKKVYGGAG